MADRMMTSEPTVAPTAASRFYGDTGQGGAVKVFNAADVLAPVAYVARNNSTAATAFKKSFAKALGGKRSRILVYSDSTGMGAGAGTNGAGTAGVVNAKRRSWPSQLAAALTAAGIPAYNESIMGEQRVNGDGVTYSQYDPRLVLAGGFAVDTTVPTIGCFFWGATATGAKWSYTPTMAFDTFDIFTTAAPGLGSVTVDVDGGASLGTINESAGFSQFIKTTYTVPRGTHTINVTATSATKVYVGGVIPYDSTMGGVDIICAAQFGKFTADLALSALPWHSSAAGIHTLLGTEIAFLQMQINDTNAGVSTTTYDANLAIIEGAMVAQGVTPILMTGIPSSTAYSTVIRQQAMADVVRARAVSRSEALMDLFARSGDYVAMGPAGLNWMFDGLHGNAEFYADEARWVADTAIRLAKG